MIFGQNHPDTIKIIFNGKSFFCHDLESEGRVDIGARSKVEDFVNELNRKTKGACLTFPYYICLFMLIYVGSFLGFWLTAMYYMMFIPAIAFISIILGIIWFSISFNNFFKNVNKTVDRYRVELSHYYIIMNNIKKCKRDYKFASNEQAIYLFPRNGDIISGARNIFNPRMLNTRTSIYDIQGHYNPNMQERHYYNRNPNNNKNISQTQGLNNGYIDTNVYTPPQNIPPFTYYPELPDDNNTNYYEDKTFENKDKKAKEMNKN